MSNYLPEQLQTAYEAYQLNPNQARQIVAATAQGHQPPSLQGLAAAAALQAPQAPVAPPQGTVLQHLAAQQGIGGQIPNVLGRAPQGVPPQAPIPQAPQMQAPAQGMAGGGIVSFMHGGDIREFATGTSELLRAQGIPDSPGYFESGDMTESGRMREMMDRIRGEEILNRAKAEQEEALRGLRGERAPVSSLQGRGGMYTAPIETPGYSSLYPQSSGVSSDYVPPRRPLAYSDVYGGAETPTAPKPMPKPAPTLMDKLSKSSAAPATKLDPRMARLAETTKTPTTPDVWTTSAEPAELLAAREADLAKLSKLGRVAGKVGKATGAIGLAGLALDPRLQAIMELSKMPVRAARGDKDPNNFLAPTAHIAYEAPKAMETIDYLKGLISGKAGGGEVKGYAAGDVVDLFKGSPVTPSIPEMLDALRKSKEEPGAETANPSYGMASLDSFSPDIKLDYSLGDKTGITPHIEKAAVHSEAKNTDPAFKKASINTSSTAAEADTVLEDPTASKPAETQGMISGSTPEETISYLQELAGGPRKLSPEMMQRLEEKVSGAKEDKWLGALMGLVGGTLSSSSPYLGQAVGEGGLKGLSAYQQGAKEQGGAEQDLLSAQLGQEDADRAAKQAAFEHYMKQEQAKMAAQTDLAKARMGWGAKDYLTQLTEAGKNARAEQMGGYRYGLQDTQTQMAIFKEGEDAVKALRESHAKTGRPVPTQEEEQKERLAAYNRANQYLQGGGLGGAGYSTGGLRIIAP